MTLRELHARLGQIIDANQRDGRDDRNDWHSIIRIKRGRNDWWMPVECVWGGSIRLDGDSFCPEIIVRENEIIKSGLRGPKDQS